MSDNTFGNLFKFTSFGESHGPAIGCIVDGVPPKIKINEEIIQKYLDRRKPGGNKFVSQRKEEDKVKILSGTFNGLTTGTPVSLYIENKDQRSKDYSEIANKFRPGHADFTYQKKYGIRDYRGGGRSSARETAVRVAAGAIADIVLKKIIGKKYKIIASVIQIGPHKIDKKNFNSKNIDKNPFFCGDKNTVKIWENFLDNVRKEGSSAGAIIEVNAFGIPEGLGQPLYRKLDSQIANAMMSINAVKGVEIGTGFKIVEIPGHEASDEMRKGTNGPSFLSNHSGGILGGISSGQPINAKVAIKPTSSILTEKQSVNLRGNNTKIRTIGRHDPCVGIRGTPVVEAMMACVILDNIMLHHAQNKIF